MFQYSNGLQKNINHLFALVFLIVILWIPIVGVFERTGILGGAFPKHVGKQKFALLKEKRQRQGFP